MGEGGLPGQKGGSLGQIQFALYENVYGVYLGVLYPMIPHAEDLRNFDVKSITFYSNSWLDW